MAETRGTAAHTSNQGLHLVEDATLTIGDLSDRSGIATATLRMWETRYGFPEPRRLSSGHRRYRTQDVELVREVVRLRDTGLRLDAAIDAVTSDDGPDPDDAPTRPEPTDTGGSPAPSPGTTATGQLAAPLAAPASAYAAVRRRLPDVVPQRLAEASLVAVAVAALDELRARAFTGVAVHAVLRTPDQLAQLRGAWDEVALLADEACLLLAYADPLAPPGARVVAGDEPLARELCFVSEHPRFPLALVGWAADADDAGTEYETVLSVDPGVVRAVADVLRESGGTPGGRPRGGRETMPPVTGSFVTRLLAQLQEARG